MAGERYFVLGLNSEPWAVGPLGISYRGKKPFPYMAPNQKLQAYQEALKGELEGAGVLEGEVEVRLHVWRRLDHATVYSGANRKAKTSDATNIQKATEDALQGVLIENDRYVRRISTEIVEQNDTVEPCIVITVLPYATQGLQLPDKVWAEIDKVTKAPSLPWSDPNSDPLSDVHKFIQTRHDSDVEDFF